MAEDVRGELAAALMDARLIRWREPELAMEFAGAVLPVVDRIARERAAEELRAVAHLLDDNGDEAIEVALGGAAYVHRVLCDCAHALDGRP